jgi:hypothetical protein
MGFILLLFCYFLYCVLSFCYRFLLLQGKGVWVFFHFKNYYLIMFLVFYFLKGEKGTELFKNLLRGEGIRLISLFWEKQMEDGSGVFFIFMLVIFWDLLLLRRGGEWGCGAFLLD